MMSKLGYADDRNEHWLPHLRFFHSGTDPATWGWSESARFSLPGWERRPGAPTGFVMAVERWQDGTEYREGSPLALHP